MRSLHQTSLKVALQLEFHIHENKARLRWLTHISTWLQLALTLWLLFFLAHSFHHFAHHYHAYEANAHSRNIWVGSSNCIHTHLKSQIHFHSFMVIIDFINLLLWRIDFELGSLRCCWNNKQMKNWVILNNHPSGQNHEVTCCQNMSWHMMTDVELVGKWGLLSWVFTPKYAQMLRNFLPKHGSNSLWAQGTCANRDNYGVATCKTPG